jgi:hypothetical protein
VESRAAQDRANQEKLKRETGFPAGCAEVGHKVVYELLRRGYPRCAALLAGHLAAVSGSFNFQGNRRLAFWLKVSERTVRRYRALLERDGWIKSCLLLPGQMVLGQRAPVVRPQVVRDVAKLQRLASVRSAVRSPHKRSKQRKPSAAERAPAVPVTAAELEMIANNAQPWIAEAMRGGPKTPKRPPAPPRGDERLVDDAELDAIDRELAELSELHRRRAEERPPPS